MPARASGHPGRIPALFAPSHRTPRGAWSASFLLPADLRRDAVTVARLIADFKVPVADMAHTHYNKISNDATNLYMATRSTGQVEEGPVGISIACIDGPVVSWRFLALQDPCPVVMITSPSDVRLLTDSSSVAKEVGKMRVSARVLGRSAVRSCEARIADGPWIALHPEIGHAAWLGELIAPKDEFELTVRALDDLGAQASQTIVVAGSGHRLPERIAHGSDAKAISPWPENGLFGTQRGPNKNGRKW